MSDRASVRRRVARLVIPAMAMGGAAGAGVAFELYPAWLGVTVAIAIALIAGVRTWRITHGLPADEIADSVEFKPPGQRIFDVVMGVVLLAVVVMAIVSLRGTWTVGAVALTVTLALLAGECLVAAARDRPSLVSKIGPLP
ncbi:hypothetical protein BH09PSE6_BH09PSE6_25440 [soil metagenome]